MAKGNLFQGQGTGKLGDIVFFRSNGQQMSRVRVRKIKNPRTVLQIANRMRVKSVSSAYSLLSFVANHSFEGFNGAVENQREFIKQNLLLLNNEFASAVRPIFSNMPDGSLSWSPSAYSLNGYSLKGVKYAPSYPYVISDGSIVWNSNIKAPISSESPIEIRFGVPNNQYIYFNSALLGDETKGITDFTYQDICDRFGFLPGDQLTFVVVQTGIGTSPSSTSSIESVLRGPNMLAARTARLILMPADGDMSKPLFVSDGGEGLEQLISVNDPNPANIDFNGNLGSNFDTQIFNYTQSAGEINGIRFHPEFGFLHDSKLMGGLIVSRFDNGIWRRSRCELTNDRLTYYPTTTENVLYGYNIADSYNSWVEDGATSGLYLNGSN